MQSKSCCGSQGVPLAFGGLLLRRASSRKTANGTHQVYESRVPLQGGCRSALASRLKAWQQRMECDTFTCREQTHDSDERCSREKLRNLFHVGTTATVPALGTGAVARLV